MKIRSFGRICLCLGFLFYAGCFGVHVRGRSHDHVRVSAYVEGSEVVTVKRAGVRVVHREYVAPGPRVIRYDNQRVYREIRSRPGRVIIHR